MYTHDLSCALPVGIESSREISAIGYDAQVRLPQVASLSQHTFYAVLSIHAMIQFLLLFISLDICVIFICSSKTIPLHPSCVMVSFTNSS